MTLEVSLLEKVFIIVGLQQTLKDRENIYNDSGTDKSNKSSEILKEDIEIIKNLLSKIEP